MLNNILPFIVLILVVVFIHEYGHYYFAKKYGVAVTDFSIGFGKEIFGWNDKSGTRWKICWIPLGGYVKFFGDRNVFSQADQEEVLKKYNAEDQSKLFILKPLYQRSLIVAAGPFANFILAIVIFFFIYTFVGKDFTTAVINEVKKDSPAYVAGLKKNDIIISIDNQKVKSILEVSKYIIMSTEEYINFNISRSNQEMLFKVKPEMVMSEDSLGNKINKRMVGIQLGAYNNEINHVKLGPAKSLYYSISEVYFVCTSTLKYLVSIVKGSGDSSQLGGPIRIAKVTAQVAEFGILPFLSMMAYISISLGLINLFPIPLLDGGHLMFYGLEKVLGKTAEKVLLPLQPGDVPDTYAEVSNLVEQFDYKPSTTIEDGIAKFISWYHEYNKP